jgi:hypothetical protein
MQNSNLKEEYPQISIGNHVGLINSSTVSRSMKKYESGNRCYLADILFRPGIVFLKSMLIDFQILHGIRGIIISMLKSYEEFLIYLKLWEIQNTSGPCAK